MTRGKRRTKDKRDVLHTAISKALLPVDIVLFEALTRRLKIIDGDANVAETLRLVVSIVVNLTLFLLGAVVPAGWWLEASRSQGA